jgi:putative salt-induced outer membrane protein YdiY
MRFSTVLILTIIAAPSILPAQDSVPKEKPIKATGDISFVKTGGNTDVTTLGLADKLEWKTSSRFTIKQNFSWVYGDDEDVISTNALLAGIRGEYGLSSRVLLFLGFNYDYDMFSGVKRRFEEYFGVGFNVIDHPRNLLRLEAGLSQFQEWELGTDDAYTFTAGRLALDYKHLFTEKAYFQQILELHPNFDNADDYRLRSETSLVAPITGGLAIKVSYTLKYRGVPPEDVEGTDTVFRTGIQITY